MRVHIAEFAYSVIGIPVHYSHRLVKKRQLCIATVIQERILVINILDFISCFC